MKLRLHLAVILLVAFHLLAGAQQWYPDILGNGFEMRYVDLGSDYSGPVRCTLVRHTSECGDSMHRGVLYIHGFNDYFFQKEMADEFAGHCYDFYAVDLRKYGRSILPDQKPFVVRSFTDYFADVDSALQAMRKAGCREIILMGHSTGGLVAAYFMATHPNAPVNALILNSPFLDWNLGWKENLIGVVSALGRLFPNIKVSTGDDDVYAETLTKGEHGEWIYNHLWKSTPYGVNLGWVRAVTLAQRYLRDHRYEIKVPVLLMFSTKSTNPHVWTPEANRTDVVLDVNDILKYGLLLGHDVKPLAVEGGMHDLILSAPQVRYPLYRYIFNWLGSNVR